MFITVIVSGVYSARADSDTDAIYNDGKYLFVLKPKSNTLETDRLLPYKKGYTYSFSDRINACCAIGNTVYTLTESGSNKIRYLYKSTDGKSSTVRLSNINTDRNTFISTDTSGNIFIINSKNKIQVFNKSGKSIKTFGAKVNRLIPFSDYALAFSGKAVYKVTSSTQTLLLSGTNTSYFYRISDNYIGDYYGNIYRISGGVKRIISVSKNGMNKACEVGKYLVYCNDKTLYIYDKNGSLVSERGLESLVYALSSYDSKAVLIDKNYNVTLLSQSELFEKNGNSNALKGINLKNFKHNKKYIYVNQGTTIADFKSGIEYDGYEISFKGRRSGKLYTNTKVSFIKGNASVNFTFIVRGDVTGEGNVNSRDEGLLFKHLLGQQKLNGVYKIAADINRDKKISNADLVLLSRIYR